MQIRSLKLALVLLLVICVGSALPRVVTIDVIRHRFRHRDRPVECGGGGRRGDADRQLYQYCAHHEDQRERAVLLRGRYPGHL